MVGLKKPLVGIWVVWSNSMFTFLGGGKCSWVVSKFINGCINGFGRWFLGVLLVLLWVFLLVCGWLSTNGFKGDIL